MNDHVARFMAGLESGDAIGHGGLILIPLRGDAYSGTPFLTLGVALEQKSLVVTEVSSNGSVPELQASNKGHLSVFIMDGEELAGAKQNRVLNT